MIHFGYLCSTCSRHRADGHKPVMSWTIEATEEEAGSRAAYCHGAGENGRKFSRLEEEPRERRVRPWPIAQAHSNAGGWQEV